MPIYEYKCKKCEHKFNEIRAVSDRDKEIECPNCNNLEEQERIIVQPISFELKGKGWYKDGY